MAKVGIVLVTALFIAGCASQIMESYVGKDIREAALDYGPPSNAIDMGDNERAFQWVMNSSFTTPVTTTTTGSVTSYGPGSWINTNTTVTGGETVNSSCIYTLMARWNERSESWIVTGFRKPRFTCE